MNTASCVSIAPIIEPTVGTTPELERLGDDIAELSAHLDAATARLLDLIRDFDLRGGWGNGFRSCAAWLTWVRWSFTWTPRSWRIPVPLASRSSKTARAFSRKRPGASRATRPGSSCDP